MGSGRGGQVTSTFYRVQLYLVLILADVTRLFWPGENSVCVGGRMEEGLGMGSKSEETTGITEA